MLTTDFATRLSKPPQTQSLSNIEDDIRRNAQNIFVFRLQDPKDIKVVAGMFSYIHVNEVSYVSNLLSNLRNRRAIAKIPLINTPFQIKTITVN